MNFIRSFFHSSPEEEAQHQVEKYLASINLYEKYLALTLSFQYQFTQSISQCSNSYLYMRQLVNKLNTTKNVSSTVKLFTIIHTAIYERDYLKDELETLEEIPMPLIQNAEETKWFGQFSSCYVNYLKKLPSVSDVYQRAKMAKIHEVKQTIYLTEIFRIINQVSLLFPSICNFTNTIGRYYLTSYPEFPQFYRMLNKEILMLYNYVKSIIDQIFFIYRTFDVEQLKCFIKTIPQIQLTCDKIEDILLNKYFKGKSIKSKIYFKEEKVQELCYFLQYQLEGKMIGFKQGEN